MSSQWQKGVQITLDSPIVLTLGHVDRVLVHSGFSKK